ncbi:MAG: YhjD/YihY/BrkB family envelope integrity protein [Pseudomonadota bacterium]
MNRLSQRLAATGLARPAHDASQRLIQVGRHLWHELDRGQINLHAMSLAFTSLLSLAPLLAVSFSVLKAFGVQDVLLPFLLNMLQPLGPQGEDIAERIVGFVENIRVGVLGAIGLALLFYTVIALMQKIERAFNDVWRVSEDRPLTQRFTHYLSVVIVGPVLLFAIISALAQLSGSAASLSIPGGAALAWLAQGLHRVSPYVMLVGAFAFIYIYVPNTRVRIAPALTGAALAALVWMFTGQLFADVVVKTGNYTAIYSAFAGLILAMLWLHLAWLILLLGANISFALQNPQRVMLDSESADRPSAETALRLGELIAADFAHAGQGWTTAALAAELHLPQDDVARVLERLHAQSLLLRDDREPATWRPAAALETIQLIALVEAAETGPPPDHTRSAAREVLQLLRDNRRRALEGQTLRTLADRTRPAESHGAGMDLPH